METARCEKCNQRLVLLDNGVFPLHNTDLNEMCAGSLQKPERSMQVFQRKMEEDDP